MTPPLPMSDVIARLSTIFGTAGLTWSPPGIQSLEAFYLWWFFGSQRPVGAIPLFQSFSLPSVFSRLDEQPTVVWASLCTGAFVGYVYFLVLSPFEGGTHLSALPLYPIYQRASLPLCWSSWRAWKNSETFLQLPSMCTSRTAAWVQEMKKYKEGGTLQVWLILYAHLHTCRLDVSMKSTGRAWSMELKELFCPPMGHPEPPWATLGHPTLVLTLTNSLDCCCYPLFLPKWL